MSEFSNILERIDAALPRSDEGDFVVFADSISFGEALENGYVDEIPGYLDGDAPSGYDADGNPLEHSDVVHDFLAFLAEQMMEMHKQRQRLWDGVREAFLNHGLDPDDLSSLSVTKGIRDYVRNARESSGPTAKQRRMITYAQKAEEAFGCSLDELYDAEEHNYAFDDLPRVGWERFKWLAALREEDRGSGRGGSLLTVLAEIEPQVEQDLQELKDVLERIGSGEWYPERNPETGEYDVESIRSTDWLIDQIVYRLYGLTEEEVRVVEGYEGTS